MDRLEQSLQKHFGWSSFRSGQRPVVEAVLAGRDALAVLPTGGGKSLCYQLPALLRGGLVVVISPLVALMEDQVLQLQRRGIAAACLHAGLPPDRRQEALNGLRDESLRLLYLAPERLQGEATRQMLETHAREGRWWHWRWMKPIASAPGGMIVRITDGFVRSGVSVQECRCWL